MTKYQITYLLDGNRRRLRYGMSGSDLVGQANDHLRTAFGYTLDGNQAATLISIRPAPYYDSVSSGYGNPRRNPSRH